MSIPISIHDVVCGVVAPATIAAIVVWLWRPSVTGVSWRALGPLLAMIGGVHAGYWLLRLGPVRPESHWHWLPWVLLLTLPAGGPLSANRSTVAARFGLMIAVAAVSGWLLVPTWDHLEPSRIVHLAVFGAALVIVAAALQPLTTRVPTLWLLVNLTGVLAAGAAILAISGSLRFAQIAGCGVAALLGIVIVARFGRGQLCTDGLILPYTLFVTGMMLIGRVNSFSDVPLVSYLLPPVAPLSLWLAANERLAGTGTRRWFVRSLPLVVCAIAVGFAVAGEFDSAEEW